MEQNNLHEKHLSGFGLRLTFIFFILGLSISGLVMGIYFFCGENGTFWGSLFTCLAVFGGVLTALGLVGTVKGRTCKWGNKLVIGISAIFCLALIGIFGVVGGVLGNKAIDNPAREKKKKKAPGFGLRLTFAILMLIITILMFIFITKIGFAKLIAPVILMIILDVLAFVCAAAGKKKEWANVLSVIIGAILSIGAVGLFALFGGLLGCEPFADVKTEERNRFADDASLKIISIPDKEWKEYISQAPQDELLVLGIGMNLWLAKTRKNTLYFMLGLLASLMLGILIAVLASAVAGIIIIVAGYVVFCTLCMRRHFVKTALNKTRSKLTAENKKALDAEFKTKGKETAAEVFITVMLAFVCEPYAMALALASAAVPSLMNTKLVIPEGYGFEALEEVKGYYAEKSFLSDVIESVTDYNINDSRRTRLNSSPADDYYKKDKYTYTDSHGYGQEVYSGDEKNFYDAGGRFQFEGEKQGDKIVVNKPKTYDDEDNTNINKLDNDK